MSSRIWRRCSMEGSMIWERCRREAPATGLGRSLFTPLPRHVSVFESPRRNSEATSSPTRIPTSRDPAEGSFLPKERDPTGFMAGKEMFWRGGGEGRSSGGKRRGERAAVGGGGTAKGAAGARWGRGGEGEMHLSGRGSRPEQPRNLFFFSTTSTTSRQIGRAHV